MARYIDKDHWEEEILIPNTSTPILGGQPVWEGDRLVDGFANIPPAILADRTRHLKNKVDNIEASIDADFSSFIRKEDNLSDLEDIQQAKYNLGLNLVDNTRDLDKPVSVPQQEALDTKVDKETGKGLSENDFTDADKNKLNGIEDNATANQTDAFLLNRSNHSGTQSISTISGLQVALDGKVDKVAGYGLSQENYTPGEKSKLAGLESSRFKGEFINLSALQAGVPSPSAGDYANVDAGVGELVQRYIWDVSDGEWVLSTSPADPLTSSQVKVLYENNVDTNAFTDAEKSKLSGIAAGATNTATPVNADWDATSGLAQILNKPTIPTIAPLADTADIASLSGSDTVTPGALGAAAAAAGTISGGSSPSFDWSEAVNYTMALTGNRTLPNPTNVLPGTTRVIVVSSSTSTTRTLAFGSNFVGDLPTVAVTNTSNMVLFLYAVSATKIVVSGVEI